MYSRSLYLKIIGCVTGIVILSLLGSWLLITGRSYFITFVCLAVILLITLFIIRLINRTNRQISLFFDSLRNKDFSQHFPEEAENSFLKRMYGEMNRITQLLSENSRDIEEKKLYYESILRVLTHEIRNSVTPITSLSADLLNYSDSYTKEQLKEGLEVINSQARSLNTFLDSYHRLTHLPDPDKQKISVSSLFLKLERLLAAEPDSRKIHYNCDTDLIIHADPNLIILALINLIRNAMQATTNMKDGEIKVEATIIRGHVQIRIADNGPGIPIDKLSSIFIPFYSTKEGGSGIGIPLSQRIMQMHGGELNVISEPGIETVFTLCF